jgi:hypothetical protein
MELAAQEKKARTGPDFKGIDTSVADLDYKTPPLANSGANLQ